MLPVALTLGDPSGIGGEISLKAWSALRDETEFFLIGDQNHMAALSASVGIPVRPISSPEQCQAAFTSGLPVLDHPLACPALPGMPDPTNAAPVVEFIREAVSLTRSGRAGAVCTNPISKKELKTGAGFRFPGHTEFLSHLCGGIRPVMMLASPELRVVPVTIHIPLCDVPGALTPDLLEATLRITHSALITDFRIPAPRIIVAGLNPHAGEGGTIGKEEETVIRPVIARLIRERMNIHGPLPADTLFHARARQAFDTAVCMYHDQALVPIKTIAFDTGVNVTLGLDFIRTSPDHGTAFDIAGSGTANPSSLIEALRLASELSGRRAAPEAP